MLLRILQVAIPLTADRAGNSIILKSIVNSGLEQDPGIMDIWKGIY
jgi:hypothetical protein